MGKDRSLFVSVMGTAGSGKTTATRLLSDTFQWQFLEENFGDNAFLPRFYEEMSRWAFHSQTFFLMEKINQILSVEGMLYEGSVIQDTPLYQDVFGYAKSQHTLGNMDDAEWALYQKIFHSFEAYLPKPDLIIYLETSLPVVQERILHRGRSYEQQIPLSYLKTLEKHNTEWLSSQSSIPVIRIGTDKLDIVRSKKAKEVFQSMIEAGLQNLQNP